MGSREVTLYGFPGQKKIITVEILYNHVLKPGLSILFESGPIRTQMCLRKRGNKQTNKPNQTQTLLQAHKYINAQGNKELKTLNYKVPNSGTDKTNVQPHKYSLATISNMSAFSLITALVYNFLSA